MMMMSNKAKIILMCVVLVLGLISGPPKAEAALGCGTVVSYLSGCLPYVTGQGPLGGCCGGVRGLNSAARSTPDRQSACACLKSLAGSYRNINLSRAAGLPSLCNVAIPYRISPSTDCSRVR